jgi:hypothetical protein
MALQTRLDVDLTPLIRGGQSAVEQNAILLTDAGRSVPLVFGTLLSKAGNMFLLPMKLLPMVRLCLLVFILARTFPPQI